MHSSKCRHCRQSWLCGPFGVCSGHVSVTDRLDATIKKTAQPVSVGTVSTSGGYCQTCSDAGKVANSTTRSAKRVCQAVLHLHDQRSLSSLPRHRLLEHLASHVSAARLRMSSMPTRTTCSACGAGTGPNEDQDRMRQLHWDDLLNDRPVPRLRRSEHRR